MSKFRLFGRGRSRARMMGTLDIVGAVKRYKRGLKSRVSLCRKGSMANPSNKHDFGWQASIAINNEPVSDLEQARAILTSLGFGQEVEYESREHGLYLVALNAEQLNDLEEDGMLIAWDPSVISETQTATVTIELP